MAEISLKIKSDFEQASADFKKLNITTEQTKKQFEAMQKAMSGEAIDKFIAKNKLNAVAITATKGAAAGLEAEYKGLQRQMELLIKKGVDPNSAALDKLKTRFNELSPQVQKGQSTMSGFTSTLGALATGFVAYKIADSIKGIAVASIQSAAAMEQNKVAFTTMLGSAEKATTLLTQIQDFAASTPFQFTDLVDASKRMIAFGFASEEVIEKLGMVGNVASGLGQPIGDMIYLFGQIKTQGRAMTQDLNQFANRGVPIYEEVAKAMGKPRSEVKKLAEEGKITYDVIEKVFKNMTSEGGKFSGLMGAQSKTLSGQWSNFKDIIEQTQTVLGSGKGLQMQKDNLTIATALLQRFKEHAQAQNDINYAQAEYISLNSKTANSLSGTQEKLSLILSMEREKRGEALLYQAYLKGDVALSQKQIDFLNQRLGLMRSLNDIGAEANKNELEAWKQRGFIKDIPTGDKPKPKDDKDRPLGTKKSEAQIMQEQLVKMAGFENVIYEERLKAATDFYTRKADAEIMWGEDAMAWQFKQASLIANNEKLSYDQKLAAMKALETATQKHSQKMIQANLQFGSDVLSTTGDMLGNIQTVMKNAGKDSYKLAVLMKGLAIAQAGVNTALAITNALAKSGTPWMGLAMAAVIGAAGAAQIAAIATTPIPSAETGIQNYTVPETRGNRNDGAAVMAQGGEQVTVTPRGEESSQMTSVNISIGETQLFSIIQRGINTGQINIADKNVGRGVFAR